MLAAAVQAPTPCLCTLVEGLLLAAADCVCQPSLAKDPGVGAGHALSCCVLLQLFVLFVCLRIGRALCAHMQMQTHCNASCSVANLSAVLTQLRVHSDACSYTCCMPVVVVDM